MSFTFHGKQIQPAALDIFHSSAMPSLSDQNTPMPAKPQSRRAALATIGMASAWLVVGLTVHFSRTTLVQWAGNRAGLNWQIDQVEWSFGERSIELHGMRINDDSWMAITDTIACRGISWTKGVLHVDRIHLGTLDITQTTTPPDQGGDIEVTSAFDWESLWTGTLQGVDLTALDWAEIRIGNVNAPDLTMGHGSCNGLTCNGQGVYLDTLEWSFVSGNLPSTDFPVELDASSLHGSWSPRGWDVQTETMSLPGLDFEGTFVWPEMTGRGQAKVAWDHLPNWVHDTDPKGWLDTLQLKGETTLLAWDLNDTLWTATADGPAWLSIWAGSANAWQGQAQIDHIPPSFKSAIPSDTLKLNAKGTQHSMVLRLTGGPEVDARWLQWPRRIGQRGLPLLGSKMQASLTSTLGVCPIRAHGSHD